MSLVRGVEGRARRLAWSYGAFLVRLGREGLFGHYFTRSIEYPLAAAWVGRGRLVDIGSGAGPFPLFLAARGCEVVAVDLDPAVERLDWWRARWLRRGGRMAGSVRPMVGDARDLPLADGSVDGALAVSSLEHVPGDGDALAMGELGRVLRVGGRAFVSVEAGAVFREVEAEHSHVVGHEYDGVQRQLVRYYDPAALLERLVRPSRLVCEACWFYGERRGPLRARFDEAAVRARWYPLTMPIARWRCRRVAEVAGLPLAEGNGSNAIACLLLRKGPGSD